MEHKGLRYNEGKLRQDLLPAYAIDRVAEVLSKGSIKYSPRNWENGMSWTSVVASLKRHLSAFEQGEDFDNETKLLHIAHVATNALFLTQYTKTYPMGDDRPHSYLDQPKIALDIDGVLADFSSACISRLAKEDNVTWKADHWTFPSKDKPIWHRILKDKDFWINLEPLCDPQLPFEPCAYVTARQIPKEWTEEWLLKWGFPQEPVFIENGKSKAEAIRKSGASIFVDDKFSNFVDLNRQKICTFLFDHSYNRKYDVGYKRIKSLNELI